MSGDWLLWAFLVGGLLLVASEAVHSTFAAFFLGAAALIVAGVLGTGLVDTLPAALALWGALSIALVLPLRPLAMKLLPGKTRHDRGDEDTAAYGEIVDVLEPVLEGEVRGRIRFQGTTWPAICIDGSVPAGGKARLVARQKLAWVVEPLNELEAADLVPKSDQKKEAP